MKRYIIFLFLSIILFDQQNLYARSYQYDDDTISVIDNTIFNKDVSILWDYVDINKRIIETQMYVEYYYSYLKRGEVINKKTFQQRVLTDNGFYFNNPRNRFSAHGIVNGKEYNAKLKRLNNIKLIPFPHSKFKLASVEKMASIVGTDSTIYIIKRYEKSDDFYSENLTVIEIVSGYRISIIDMRTGVRGDFQYNKEYEAIMAEMIPTHSMHLGILAQDFWII